jgi:hypothetical protein
VDRDYRRTLASVAPRRVTTASDGFDAGVRYRP